MAAHRIIQHIFQQPGLAQVPTSSLEELVAEYPYFTAARLLMAQKDYERYPSLHTPAIKKAQLYSNNPHYFYQLVTGEAGKTTVTPAAFVPPVEPTPPPVTPSWQPVAEKEPEGELSTLLRERREMMAAIKQMESLEEEETGAPAADTESFREERTVTSEAFFAEEEDADTEAFEEETAPEASFKEEEETAPESFEEERTTTQEAFFTEEEEEEETVPEAFEQPGRFSPPAPSAEAGPGTEEPPEETDEETPTVQEAETFPANELTVNQQTTTDEEEPIKIFPLDIPAEETTLTFQPLYTDDYFAYKRLKEPENAEGLNEKGMADMRSFTDWLREMKHDFAKKADKDWYHQQLHRIYVDEEPEVSEAVEKMAMESITLNDDIVSETLAEIWAKQHQYQTAIQIYQKLSLLNPNKSAYFAQKIQELQLQQSEFGKN